MNHCIEILVFCPTVQINQQTVIYYSGQLGGQRGSMFRVFRFWTTALVLLIAIVVGAGWSWFGSFRTVQSTQSTVLKTSVKLTTDLNLPSESYDIGFHNLASGNQKIVLDTHNNVHGRVQPADVTAIVLNWSRLENVVRIVALLCGPSLQDIIAEVFVWNNSPKRIDQEVCMHA